VIDLLVKGGIVMIPIGLVSLIAAVIVIERLIYYRRTSINEAKVVGKITASIQEGHFDEALAVCESSSAPIASLARIGITNRHRPYQLLRESIVDAANLEVSKLERYLSGLGTVATIAPLLGLLGTVTGIINAFGVVGRFGEVGDPALLARGIAEALITTAAGLVVSIPATVFYNYLLSRANHMTIRLENRASEMLALLVVQLQGARK
jgi:biopolymer transport protein ExbB